ncbi:MAG TPA: hypothetical protein VK465_14540, partial [Fibrobacteria bacterium]|nr:hypothetical protein [Fibrobacteria bacterium]
MAGIRPNKPHTPQVPFKIKEENAGAGKSAAPVAGKGKQPVKLTPQEEAKLNAKIEKQEMKAAIEASIKSENERVGAGTSGTAGESNSSSSTTLGRTQSLPHSSSVSSNLSELSLPSVSSNSTVPSWVGGDNTPHGSEASTKYFTAASSFGSTSSAEPTTPGSSHHTRSTSESSVKPLGLTIGNFWDHLQERKVIEGKQTTPGVYHTDTTPVKLNQTALHKDGRKVVEHVGSAGFEPGKTVYPQPGLMYGNLQKPDEIKGSVSFSKFELRKDNIDRPFGIPEIGSGPSSPAVKPTADQAGRPEFPGSTSLSSLLASSPANSSKASTDWELPVTKWPE